MTCLHCGDCCLRMSPLSYPDPCPHLLQDGTFYFCGCYDSRPEQCRLHGFPHRFCPIGVGKLGLDTADKVRQRIDEGWRMLQMRCDLCGGSGSVSQAGHGCGGDERRCVGTCPVEIQVPCPKCYGG